KRLGSLSRAIKLMLSTPPPMAASAPSVTIWCAAMAIAWRPDEQNRFTVIAAVETGRPARRADTRAMLCPCIPWGWPQPRITSSISLGSNWGVLRSTSLMQCAANYSGRVMLKEPRKDFASPVRELATTTASLMSVVGRSPWVNRRWSLVKHYGMARHARRLQLFVCRYRRMCAPPYLTALRAGRAPTVRRAYDEIR